MLYRPGLLGRQPCPSGWYADSGPPTINEDFTTAIPSGWIFSRGTGASNCLYTDSATAPAYTAYAANAPRFLDFGLLMEPQRTNLFLNSDAPVTQSIAVVNATTYTVWCHGTGSVALAGLGASGTVVAGTPVSFTANTSGLVSCTCSGTLTRVQFEAGPGPTSYIASTATAQTRQEDRLYKNYLGGQLNVNEGTYWVEWSAQYPVTTAGLTRLFTAGVGSYSSDANTDQAIFFSGTPYVFTGVVYDGTSTAKCQSAMFGPRALGAVSRTAVSVSLHRCKIAQDYALDVNPPQDPNFRPPTLLAVTLFGGGNNVPMNGFLRGFKYWPVAMPDAELKECTGAGYYGGPPVFNLDLTTKLPRIMTFARAASTAVCTDSRYTDAPGSAYNTFAGPPAPRFVSNGLMMEVGRNNYFPIGGVPATKPSLSLGANQGYKLWIVGTGSVTVTPGTTTPDFAGNGGVATQGNPLFIQCTVAGTVTLTVSGTVNRAQIEQVGNNSAGYTPTTFIQNSAALQSRGAENLNMVPGPWWSQHDRTYFFEVTIYAIPNTQTLMSCGSADGTEREQVFFSAVAISDPNTTVNVQCENITPSNYDPAANILGLSQAQILRNHKFAYTTSQGSRRSLSMDGMLSTNNSYDVAKPQPALLVLNTALQALTGGYGSGVWRRFAFYDYALTDAQLVALTT